MKLPRLIEQSVNQREIVSFGGLNKTDRYTDGEMVECKNLSAERFPALYPSRLGKPVWEEEGLTDIFWHKNGYLSIVNNELSFTRYAEKNKIEVAEVGWYPRFTISKLTKYTDYKKDPNTGEKLYYVNIYTVEAIAKNRMEWYVGQTFSFENTEDKITYTFYGWGGSSVTASKRYFKAYIRESDLDKIGVGTIIYMENTNATSLEVMPVDTMDIINIGTNSFHIENKMTSNQLSALKDEKMLLDYKFTKTESGTTTVVERKKIVTITKTLWKDNESYINLDMDIECISGILYPYEHYTIPNTYTNTEMLSEEPLGINFSDEEYIIYKDTYSTKLSNGKKQICVVGDIICIFPDKGYYDADKMKFWKMNSSFKFSYWTFTERTLTLTFSANQNPFCAGDTVKLEYVGYGTSSEENEGKNEVIGTINSVSSSDDKTFVFSFTSNIFKEEDGSELSSTYLYVTRKVPDLDFVCAKGSRLYGVDKDRIYVSKYGSPQNFQFFQGGAMDSYYIDVASPGEFTGCIPYSSYVLFFKENEIIKLYGEQPSDYQIVTTACSGVAPSSERSLCEVSGVLFYLGSDGVYAYSGGYPSKISLPLGSEKLTEGVGGRNGLSYYISAKGENGERRNYTYDTENGIWLSEDIGEVSRFLTFNDEAAYLNSGGLYMQRQGEYGDFSATFCTVYENAFNKKKYQKFYIRAEVPEGARFKVEMSRDGGDYYEIKNVTPRRSQIVTVPLAPNRCDRFSVRISGRGAVKILSFMREFSVGSVK